MAAAPTLREPLLALGPSVFLHICHFLPYLALARLPSVCRSWRDFSATNESGIWRAASHRLGVDPEEIAQLREVERDSRDPNNQARAATPVDWKKVCIDQVMPDINWSRGRFDNFFIRRAHRCDVGDMAAYAVDEEDRTCYLSSIWGGIRVIDVQTERELFSMTGVCMGINIHFCRGVLAFRAGEMDFRYRIFRTRHAIARSAHPWAAATALVNEAISSRFFDDPEWRPDSVLRPQHLGPDDPEPKAPPPIGRGCLAFYRDIMLPSYAMVSRMKALGDGTGRERVKLGAAREGKVFLWDVDEADEPPEVYEYPKRWTSLRRLDFDDDFIFLCQDLQLHVISRSTRRVVLAFPPDPIISHTICAVAYRLDPATATREDEAGVIDLTGEDDEPLDFRESSVLGASVYSQGHLRGSAGHDDFMLDLRYCWRESKLAHSCWWSDPGATSFVGCRLSGTDLICVHEDGFIFITRDFAAILAVRSAKERARKWGQQTIILDLPRGLQSLAVYGTRVAVGTRSNILFFDTGTLPSLPLPAPTAPRRPQAVRAPPIRMRKLLRVCPAIQEFLGDPQIYSTAMFTSYIALDRSGIGLSVRGLQFGPDVFSEGEEGVQGD